MWTISAWRKTLDTTLIIGYGDIGRRVATLCRQRGWQVNALSRQDVTATQEASAAGVTVYMGDLDHPDDLPALPTAASLVFYFAPPPRDTNDSRIDGFLRSIPDTALPRKIIYTSTSGVYGDHQGAWVTENSMLNPTTDRARRRLSAERLLGEWGKHNNVPVVILRVGGIYGPGRLPLERLRKGTPVLREADCGYTNRIHADDLAMVCLAAAQHGHGIYNISDGNPTTMTDYFNEVAKYYKLPAPTQISLDQAKKVLSPEMMSYLMESRRLDNHKMLRELGVKLRYPTLREGLSDIASTGQSDL